MAEIDVEKERTRAEVASYLREFADTLDPMGELTETGSESPGRMTEPGRESTGEVADLGDEHDRNMTIIVDNESATVTPPDSIQFRVEVETDSSLLETGMDRGVMFSLRWDANQVDSPDELEIE